MWLPLRKTMPLAVMAAFLSVIGSCSATIIAEGEEFDSKPAAFGSSWHVNTTYTANLRYLRSNVLLCGFPGGHHRDRALEDTESAAHETNGRNGDRHGDDDGDNLALDLVPIDQNINDPGLGIDKDKLDSLSMNSGQNSTSSWTPMNDLPSEYDHDHDDRGGGGGFQL